MKRVYKGLIIILSVIILIGVLPMFAYAGEKNSDAGSGNSYAIVNSGMKWTEAKEYCESRGGHLVTITSQEEQTYIEQLIQKYGQKNMYWIGLYDDGSNKNWSWVTGEKMVYENWRSGEPNTLSEIYGEIYGGKKDDYGFYWNDSCNSANGNSFHSLSSHGFIIEYENNPSTLSFSVNKYSTNPGYNDGITFTVKSSVAEKVRVFTDATYVSWDEYSVRNGSATFKQSFHRSGKRSVQVQGYVNGSWSLISDNSVTITVNNKSCLGTPVFTSISNNKGDAQVGKNYSLRWNKVTNAVKYAVYVSQNNIEVWKTTVTATEVSIPAKVFSTTGIYNVDVYATANLAYQQSNPGARATINVLESVSNPLTVDDIDIDIYYNTVTWTASASGGSGTLQYQFDMYVNGIFAQRQKYSTSNKFVYKATESGSYWVAVTVKDSNGKTATKTSSETKIDSKPLVFDTFDVKNDNGTISWKVIASGGVGTLSYECILKVDILVGRIRFVRSFNFRDSNIGYYDIPCSGTYYLAVTVTDSAGNKLTKESEQFTINLDDKGKLSVNYGNKQGLSSNCYGGKGLVVTVTSDNAWTVQSDSDWISLNKTSGYNGDTFQPTIARNNNKETRTGYITVKSNNCDDVKIKVTQTGALTIESLSADKSTVSNDEKITWTIKATGGSGNYRYSIAVFSDDHLSWQSPYSVSPSITYTVDAKNRFYVQAFVADSYDEVASRYSSDLYVDNDLRITKVWTNKTSVKVGKSIRWYVEAEGGEGDLEYKFVVYRGTKKMITRKYGSSDEFKYYPKSKGTYKAKIFARDEDGNTVHVYSGEVTVK